MLEHTENAPNDGAEMPAFAQTDRNVPAIVKYGLSTVYHSEEQARSKVSDWVDGITIKPK